MQARHHQPKQHSGAGGASMYTAIEDHLRAAGRGLELIGVTDQDAARLAGICFRLAQRVAVDSGRLESPA